jgi:hypothetical protein
MKLIRTCFMAVAALSLAACAVGTPGIEDIPISPGAVADKTVLDEKAGIAAEAAYQTASVIGMTLATLGFVPVDEFKAFDNKIYACLEKTRLAYNLGNSDSYLKAADGVKKLSAAVGSPGNKELQCPI